MISVPFLNRLDQETVEMLGEMGVKRVWPRGGCIFRTGEACTGVHFIESGLVKLYRSNSNGREQIVLLEGAGSVLALAPVLDHGVQLATAEALKATTTVFLPSEVFVGMFRERDDVRDAVASEMARRLRLAFGLLETIALKPVVSRVATRVLELAITHDALDGTRGFRLLLSQDELAHVLATSRESVARALAELRADGVIEQRGAQVKVLDPRALFEWSNASDEEVTSTPLPASI